MTESDSLYQTVPDEKTAVKLVEARNSRNPRWFCPLINNECNPKCYCFTKASYFKERQGPYKIQEAYCNNAMFLGSDCNGG